MALSDRVYMRQKIHTVLSWFEQLTERTLSIMLLSFEIIVVLFISSIVILYIYRKEIINSNKERKKNKKSFITQIHIRTNFFLFAETEKKTYF